MSKDIRSYFTSMSSNKSENKSNSISSTSRKRPKAIASSDEDVKTKTPLSAKISKKAKKRKVQIISSDSDEEKTTKAKISTNNIPESKLKPIKITDTLGNEPIKQSAVREKSKLTAESPGIKTIKKKQKAHNTEINIHETNLEKTLLDLDEDILENNIDVLDKIINETLMNVKHIPSTLENKKSPNKSPKMIQNTSNIVIEKYENEEYNKDSDQDRFELKRQKAILYQKYLNRSGPLHHGTKELPKGKPTCLNDLCFIRTGVLDSLDNSEFETLIKDHGGRVVHGISKKVNYVVAGEEAGPAKIEKAKNYNIKIISEDELLDLIRIKSGIKPLNANEKQSDELIINKNEKKKSNVSSEASSEHRKKSDVSSKNINATSKHNNVHISSTTDVTKIGESKLNKKIPEDDNKKSNCSKMISAVDKSPDNNSKTAVNILKHVTNISSNLSKKSTSKTEERGIKTSNKIIEENLPWTEKHKPKDIKAIIGQQGENSNLNRLISWLQNWYKNHTGKNKPKLVRPSPWAKKDDGSYFKAALLSGPPGVGKTTTAHLVAEKLGFDVVEFNASDTRNKRLLHEEVSQLLSSKSLAGFANKGSAPTSKHVLLMDEVDGMAGNEDRGGMQELIGLIKNSNVPIICMCNDRNSQKMRSLVNYCYDLRFSRPRVEQIKGAMMTVCFKEGIKISPNALAEVIMGAGLDIRQTLTHLSMWSVTDKIISNDTATTEANLAKKDTVMGPWEVCRSIFSEETHKTVSVSDQARMYFYDYSLTPLFIQENYLKVLPRAPKNVHLKCLADAADSISMGDIIDASIRRNNNWVLLNSAAMVSFVLPGYYMKGHMNAQIDFPGWLGKNSKKNKFVRLVSELQSHMRTSISGSRLAVNLDYVTCLRNRIVQPLIKNGASGVSEAIDIIHDYSLLREDLDSIIELAQWPQQKDPMSMVDSKVKAALTRTYNKEGAKLPYAISIAPVKKRGTITTQENDYDLDEDLESESEENDDFSKDGMIKTKKVATSKAKKTENTQPSTSTKRSVKHKTSKPPSKKSKK